MIGYFVLLQVFVVMVQARPNHIGEMILNNLMENDANLNAGFDIEAYRLDQLNLHNYYRSLHGAPAMTRSATLEAKAQEYAEILAANNHGLIHCQPPSCDRQGAGENLASAGGSTTAETNATKEWYEEVWDYNYCHEESNFTRPGHAGKAIGHFTQVIWDTSIELGIGYARTANKKKVYVVGRYFEHGNGRRHYEENVHKADYLFNIFQDNCDGDNGGLTAWSEPGECSRSCGGGARFQTRTCTNPKPSWNGADCDGKTAQLAAEEWCNIESCSAEDKSHRAQQCEARGHPAKSRIFSNYNECTLYCLIGSGTTYYAAGKADDGTHCDSDSGVCVGGECKTMPKYVAPTEPPPTNAAGQIIGSYTGTPSSNIWNNEIFTIPNGATNVVITNKKYNDVSISIGYKRDGSQGYRRFERSWMNTRVKYFGFYKTTRRVVGVSFAYKRVAASSTFTIAGPVHPRYGYSLVLFVSGRSPADISWAYDA